MKTLWYVFVIMTVYQKAAEGSCLSYGHSCWGAHGKRANLPPTQGLSFVKDRRLLKSLTAGAALNQQQALGNAADRWALVKILPEKRPGNSFIPGPNPIIYPDTVKMRVPEDLSEPRYYSRNEEPSDDDDGEYSEAELDQSLPVLKVMNSKQMLNQ